MPMKGPHPMAATLTLSTPIVSGQQYTVRCGPLQGKGPYQVFQENIDPNRDPTLPPEYFRSTGLSPDADGYITEQYTAGTAAPWICQVQKTNAKDVPVSTEAETHFTVEPAP